MCFFIWVWKHQFWKMVEPSKLKWKSRISKCQNVWKQSCKWQLGRVSSACDRRCHSRLCNNHKNTLLPSLRTLATRAMFISVHDRFYFYNNNNTYLHSFIFTCLLLCFVISNCLENAINFLRYLITYGVTWKYKQPISE